MESSQCAAVTHTDKSRCPEPCCKQPEHRRLRVLVKGRSRFVHEKPRRLINQGPHKSKALLFPHRKDMGPVSFLIKPVGKIPDPALFHQFPERLIGKMFRSRI